MSFSRDDTKAVKGIAIILMFYHHLFAFPDRINGTITYISPFKIWDNTSAFWVGQFGKLCVLLFIFLGGYGTYYCCKNKDSAAVTGIIKNKCKNLYFTYWKVFAIFIPICMLFSVDRVEKTLEAVLWNFSGLKITYNGEWWFFTPYLLLLVSFPIINQIGKIKNIFTDIIIVLAVNCIINYVIPTLNNYQWAANLYNSLFYTEAIRALTLLPGFLVGCLCAKYDILSKIKTKFSGNFVYCLFACFMLFSVFFMRIKTGGVYDFIYAPLFTVSAVIMLNHRFAKYIRKILVEIGNESTIMWLTHSFYCYMLCQKLVFLPRYSPLIVIWLLLICYLTSKGIKLLFLYLSKLWSKIKAFLKIQPA